MAKCIKNGNSICLHCFGSMPFGMQILRWPFEQVFIVPRRMILCWHAGGKGQFCNSRGGKKLLCAISVPPALLASLNIYRTTSLPGGSQPRVAPEKCEVLVAGGQCKGLITLGSMHHMQTVVKNALLRGKLATLRHLWKLLWCVSVKCIVVHYNTVFFSAIRNHKPDLANSTKN